jgi:transcriptional regulator with XRE-family HTH domain
MKQLKTENFGRNLRLYLVRNNIPQKVFAKELGMTNGNLNKIVNGNMTPMFRTIVAVINKTQIPFETFMEDIT